jgi:hypothetical protein
MASAISGLHVSQRYGLADLDAAGQWIQTDDLGVAWQPKAAEGWTPYRSGRWRWLDGLGYTWISDEAWGWLPYHFGRWTRHGDLGWVWSPGTGRIFKPGEVFWMRGARFAAWGPLAPGEDWNPANIPAHYAGANLTFAAFLPETPEINPAGFTDKPKEPLKASAFVAALPSPALLPARLDAVRALVPVNALRVTPIAEPSTEAPAAAVRSAPRPIVATPPQPAPAPEEVFVPVPVYAGFFWVRPAAAPPPAPAQSAAAASAKPAPKPIAIPAPLPHGSHHPVDRSRDAADDQPASLFQADLAAGRWAKALKDLDDWTRANPQSKLATLRLYDYMQVHSAMAHPERVLEYGAAVMSRSPAANQGEGSLSEQQMAGVLFLTVVNAAAIAKPSHDQRALGLAAAQSLLDILPRYFQDNRRPAESSYDLWTSSRKLLETAARDALKKLSGRPAA